MIRPWSIRKRLRILRAAYDMYIDLENLNRGLGYNDDHEAVVLWDDLVVKTIKKMRALLNYINS